jgi:WD40 repeat protein
MSRPSRRMHPLTALSMLLFASMAFAQEAAAPKDQPAAKLDRYGDPLPKGAVDRLGTVRLRPPHVHGFRFSPDRHTLFTIGMYGDLNAWDADTGKKLRTLGKTKGLWLAISRDGKLLATWYPGTPVDFWDAAAGTKIRTWDGRFTGFAEDDTLLPNGELRLRDITNPAKEIPAKGDPRNAHLRSEFRTPDGSYRLITDIAYPSVEIWDAAKNELIGEIKPGNGGHDEHLFCTGLTSDNKTYISAWKSGIRIFSMTEKRERALLPIREAHVFSIAPDGKRLAVATQEGSIVLFDIESAKEIRRWPADCGRWNYLTFSRDNKTLASAAGSSIRFWNPETGERKDPYRDFDDEIKSIRFSPDGATFVVDGLRQFAIVDARSFRRVASIPRDYPYDLEVAQVYSQDSKTLAFVAQDPVDHAPFQIRSVETATGKDRLLLPRAEDNSILPFGLGFGRNGLRIFSQDNGHLVVTDGASGKEISRHRWTDENFPEDRSKSIVSPDGMLLACTEGRFSEEQTPILLDAASGAVLRKFEVPNGLKRTGVQPRFDEPRTVPVGFSGLGRSFLAALVDPLSNQSPLETGTRELFLWETATGQLRGRWKGEPKKFSAYAISPNGRVLATAAGNVLRAFDPATGDELARFESHDSVVVALGLSPDGRKVVSGAADGTVTLWDLSPAFAAPTAKLGDERLKSLWNELESADGQAAFRAIGTLSRHPDETLPFLRPLLPHGPAADPKVVARLVADLDHEDFAVREKASAALARLGHAAAPLLRSAANSATSPETRGRLRALVARLDNAGIGTARTRSLRALEVLERIGSAEARAVLRDVRDFGDRAIAEGISDAVIAEPVNRLPDRP